MDFQIIQIDRQDLESTVTVMNDIVIIGLDDDQIIDIQAGSYDMAVLMIGMIAADLRTAR